MAKEDIVKHQFKKGQSGNPKGRPPKVLSAVLKELTEAGYERVTQAMVIEAYEILLGLPRPELAKVANDENQPAVVRIVARAMLSKNKSYEVLEKMLDRAQGRPKQSVEAELSGGPNIALVKFMEPLPNGDTTADDTDGSSDTA